MAFISKCSGYLIFFVGLLGGQNSLSVYARIQAQGTPTPQSLNFRCATP